MGGRAQPGWPLAQLGGALHSDGFREGHGVLKSTDPQPERPARRRLEEAPLPGPGSGAAGQDSLTGRARARAGKERRAGGAQRTGGGGLVTNAAPPTPPPPPAVTCALGAGPEADSDTTTTTTPPQPPRDTCLGWLWAAPPPRLPAPGGGILESPGTKVQQRLEHWSPERDSILTENTQQLNSLCAPPPDSQGW